MTIEGAQFTTELRTALDVTRWALDLTEAVVAVDSFLHFRVVTPRRLEAAMAHVAAWPGGHQARRAIDLSSGCVLSPWESRLRMFYVLELRLPSPLVNEPVFDLQQNFLGAPDLLDVDAGLALEGLGLPT